MSLLREAQALLASQPSLAGLPLSALDPLLNLLLQGSFTRQPLLVTLGDVLSNVSDFQVSPKYTSTIVKVASLSLSSWMFVERKFKPFSGIDAVSGLEGCLPHLGGGDFSVGPLSKTMLK